MPRKKSRVPKADTQEGRSEKPTQEENPRAEEAEQYKQPDYLQFIHESDLTDPLTDTTRRERRHLLIAALVSLAITLGNLIPSKVTALGISISEAQQVNLHLLLALIILYFMFAFCFYGHVDYQQWRVKIDTAQRYRMAAIKTLMSHFDRSSLLAKVNVPQTKKEQDEQLKHLSKAESYKIQIELSENLMRATKRRVFFEFAAPLGAGLWALVLVLGEGRGFVFFERPSVWAVDHPVSSIFLLSIVAGVCIAWAKIRDIRNLKRKIEEWRKRRVQRRREKIIKRMKRIERNSPEWLRLQQELSKSLEDELRLLMRRVGVKDFPIEGQLRRKGAQAPSRDIRAQGSVTPNHSPDRAAEP